ncbi:hypothetical protein ACFWFZ_15565 [Streptomyces sp. NPDC060232]|uniref:hypothetical protein n=1 Tax=Streptomyces sp. NPDC060232 TaxID=3347079 RepID=UPI003660E686
MLMRAPKESGSWTWVLDDMPGPGLEFALATAARMSAVLAKHDLMELHALEWPWFQTGSCGLGVHSRLRADTCSLDDPALPDLLGACRPIGHPQAEIGGITLLGTGAWFDAAGERHMQYRLVELLLVPDEMDVWVELSVHHGVWGHCDFRGRPQPLTHANNAPRLAAALQELEQVLGVAAEPGEPTYYGGSRAKDSGLPTSSTGSGRTSPMRRSAVGDQFSEIRCRSMRGRRLPSAGPGGSTVRRVPAGLRKRTRACGGPRSTDRNALRDMATRNTA